MRLNSTNLKDIFFKNYSANLKKLITFDSSNIRKLFQVIKCLEVIKNNNKKVIQSCAVRAEGNKFTYIDFLKDVQAFTGGEIIDSKKGLELKNFKREWLGFCRHALIKKQKTIIQAYPENMSIENMAKKAKELKEKQESGVQS